MGLSFSSYINRQTPQQNQTLQGNPSTDPNAQTSWMNPSSSSSSWNTPSSSQQIDNQPSIQSSSGVLGNGTALDSIVRGGGSGWNGNTGIGGTGTGWSSNDGSLFGDGNQGLYSQNSYINRIQPSSVSGYGSAPLGFDQAKWNDPSAGNSLKYQVGRMAQSGMPIQQIAQNVGAKVISPDKIQYPDGFIADIYYDYGGPNQRVQYTDVTGGGENGQPFNSYMNNGQGGQLGIDPNQQKFLQQLMFQIAQQNQPNTFQPMGGGSAATAGNPNQFYGIGSGQNGMWF